MLVRLLTALLAALLFVQYPAYLYSLGTRFFWYDMTLHFLGGVWVAGMALYYRFVRVGRASTPARGSMFSFATVSVLVVGIGWEIFEIVVDTWTGAGGYRYLDGGSDLIFDILGASVAVLFFTRRFASHKDSRVY